MMRCWFIFAIDAGSGSAQPGLDAAPAGATGAFSFLDICAPCDTDIAGFWLISGVLGTFLLLNSVTGKILPSSVFCASVAL